MTWIVEPTLCRECGGVAIEGLKAEPTSGHQLAEREWSRSQAALVGTAGDSIYDRMREQDEHDRRHEQRVAAEDEAREEREA